MGSRATSLPLAHGQEGVVLHVGGDERETFLKSLRSCAFNRRRLPPLREFDRKSRKVVYSINLGEAPQRALSVPLTSDNGQRKHSRLANIQQFDASALGHPDTNLTGVGTSSNIGNLSNPSDILPQPDRLLSCPRRTSLSQHLADEGSQQPSFHERPFPRGTGTGRTRWFCSSSTHQLLCPNEDVAGLVGDLYVHTNTRSNLTYLWVLHPAEGWIPIEPGADHPTVPKRRLQIRKDGDPSWVQIRSLISMESREHRR